MEENALTIAQAMLATMYDLRTYSINLSECIEDVRAFLLAAPD